jgi:type IV pilus assembly protein PilA
MQAPAASSYHTSHPPPHKSGFPTWLVVLLAVVGGVIVIGSVLAVLAIYGVRKYIANAKTAEARNSLAFIAKDAAEAYEREDRTKTGAASSHRICPSASRPVPASLSMVSGKKYQSSLSEWHVDAASNAGFACLKFEMDMPQYYQYGYDATPRSFVGTAHGDLNGDGVPSTFTIRGDVSSSGNGNGNLVMAPHLEETNPEE